MDGNGGGKFLNGWNDGVKMKYGDFHGSDVAAKVNDDGDRILVGHDGDEILNGHDCDENLEGNEILDGNDGDEIL